MNALKTFILSLTLFCTFLWCAHGALTCTTAELSGQYRSLSLSERQDFHKHLMRAVVVWSSRTQYAEGPIREDFSYQWPSLNTDWLNWIISSAQAQQNQGFCLFGGWPSMYQRSQCLPPWNAAVRREMSDYGPVYDGSFSCGGAGLFRCNPIIFGGPSENPERGHCVQTDDRDPKAATLSCLENFSAEDQQRLLESLAMDPEKLSIYLGLAAEIIGYCREQGNSFTSCQRLTQNLELMSSKGVRCHDRTALYPYLPSLVTPLNSDELDRIADGLASSFQEYQLDLEMRQAEAVEHNLRVYQEAFSQYSDSPEVEQMISTLRNNLTRCLGNACRGTKRANVSVAYCARYVKHGMQHAFLNGDYPDAWNYRYAAHSDRWLTPAGFVNILDLPGMESMTPENAPIGSVVVFDRVGSRRTPGHIEVKTGDREYMSDFVTSTPTRLGGQRRVTGIFIKLPDDIKEQLVEVPEI
jgi:hypothetical protein